MRRFVAFVCSTSAHGWSQLMSPVITCDITLSVCIRSPDQPCCPFFMKTIMKLHRFMRSHHISHSFESKSKVGIPLESKQQNSRNLSLAERRETGHEVTPVLNIFTMIWLGTLVWIELSFLWPYRI